MCPGPSVERSGVAVAVAHTRRVEHLPAKLDLWRRPGVTDQQPMLGVYRAVPIQVHGQGRKKAGRKQTDDGKEIAVRVKDPETWIRWLQHPDQPVEMRIG